MSDLKETDPEVYQAIRNEGRRQELNLELIASENVVSDEQVCRRVSGAPLLRGL